MRVSAFLKAFAFLVAIGYALIRRRWPQQSQVADESKNLQSEDDVVDDESDKEIDQVILAEAELVVSRPIVEQRRALVATHELWLHMSTYQGATGEDVENVVSFLKENGIRPEVLFEPALTPRAARQMKMMGLFELYVPKHDITKADGLMDQYCALG